MLNLFQIWPFGASWQCPFDISLSSFEHAFSYFLAQEIPALQTAISSKSFGSLMVFNNQNLRSGWLIATGALLHLILVSRQQKTKNTYFKTNSVAKVSNLHWQITVSSSTIIWFLKQNRDANTFLLHAF